MSGIDDVLREGFERHSRALGKNGGIGREQTGGLVGAIRRRRRIRAGVTGAVAAVAIGGLAAGAAAILPLRLDDDRVGPGLYPWCDPGTYPVPNPEAYTEYSLYEGRVYADFEAMEFVYVTPEGSPQVLEPDEDGDYVAIGPDGQSLRIPYVDDATPDTPPWTTMAFDYWGSGAVGGTPYLEAPVGLNLGYEWTTVVPDEVPDGIDVRILMEAHRLSIGFNAIGLRSSAVPDGALVQTVVRRTDGREEATDIGWDKSGAPVHDHTDLESVSLRVSNLPDGEVFEIVSTYDPTMTWAAACTGPIPEQSPSPSPTPSASIGPSPSPSDTPSPSPSSELDPWWGPAFEGPESVVFACGRPLPSDAEDVIPLTVETQTGTWYSEEFGEEFDFGSWGVILAASYDQWPMENSPFSPSLGWMMQTEGLDETGAPIGSGVVTFGALAWVDANDVLVGREEFWPEDMENGVIRGFAGWEEGEDGRMNMETGQLDLPSKGLPCDGIDIDLQNASIVWVHGAGPSQDEMTWSWTRLTEGSES